MPIDWRAVAERVRGLVSREDEAEISATPGSRATLRVIGAVVRVYGLDPSWVLTGKYDAATHRQALQGSQMEIDEMLRRQLSDTTRVTPRRLDRHATPV